MLRSSAFRERFCCRDPARPGLFDLDRRSLGRANQASARPGALDLGQRSGGHVVTGTIMLGNGAGRRSRFAGLAALGSRRWHAPAGSVKLTRRSGCATSRASGTWVSGTWVSGTWASGTWASGTWGCELLLLLARCRPGGTLKPPGLPGIVSGRCCFAQRWRWSGEPTRQTMRSPSPQHRGEAGGDARPKPISQASQRGCRSGPGDFSAARRLRIKDEGFLAAKRFQDARGQGFGRAGLLPLAGLLNHKVR
jgi:hypothetical protein